MPGSIHAAMYFNEPEPDGFWLGEDRTEETTEDFPDDDDIPF